MSRWNSSVLLPESVNADDLVSFQMDSSQLGQVVTAILKTIHSQSQCIETLDKEARARKMETDNYIKNTEMRLTSDIERLTEEFRECVGQLREEAKKREAEDYQTRAEISNTRHEVEMRSNEMMAMLGKNAERVATELDQLASTCSQRIKDESNKANALLRDELALRDEMSVRLRDDVDVLSTDCGKLREFATQLGEDNGRMREQVGILSQELRSRENDLENVNKRREEEVLRHYDQLQTVIREMDTVRNLTNQVKQDLVYLQKQTESVGQAADANAKAIYVNQTDIDSVLLFFSLTKNAVGQANKCSNQTDIILSTPAFRKLQGELTTRTGMLDRRIEEIFETLQTHTVYINKKADMDALQQTQEILIQTISNGDKDMNIALEGTRAKLEDRINQLGDRVNHRPEAGELERSNEVIHDRLYEISGLLDSIAYRVTAVEKEVVSQNKVMVKRSELDSTVSELRGSLPNSSPKEADTRAPFTLRSLSPAPTPRDLGGSPKPTDTPRQITTETQSRRIMMASGSSSPQPSSDRMFSHQRQTQGFYLR